MQAKTINSMRMEIAIGAVLVMAGLAALVGELNAATADVIVRLWPAGLIVMGLALFVKRS